jgi:hypothetical protein
MWRLDGANTKSPLLQDDITLHIKSHTSTYIHALNILGVPGGKVNILGGHSIGHSKQKCMCTCVLFRTVTEIELSHCTVPKLLIRKRCYVLSNTSIYC